MAGTYSHPKLPRRAMLEAGSLSLLGLASAHVSELRAASTPSTALPTNRRVIYIFLSGGLAQQDSFDPKPLAPENVRGEFLPIDTATPGMMICEHLPMLAQRSRYWSLIRSLTHPTNDHSLGHHVMLTGRSTAPPTFNANKPMPQDYPSIAAVAGAVLKPRNNLPPAVVLPERLIHRTGRVIPGQFAGEMGSRRDPWFVEASPFNATTYGAFPEYEFHHARGPEKSGVQFQAPNLSLPESLTRGRLDNRLALLSVLDQQRKSLETGPQPTQYSQHRENAVSLLTDAAVREAFDVTRAPDDVQDRYGRNAFGWSLLMARRLVGAGVNLVQVNLGNNEAWDTHGNAFPNLKNLLLPPTDRGLSALLDDLAESGELDSTLIVMAGEFGRTPKIFGLPEHYKLPGRDHWGAVQTVFMAGGGCEGGRIVGASDALGGYPTDNPQTPENLGATIYESLGLPQELTWHDDLGRPHPVYHGTPIAGL